jgi:hypothetical protein
MHASSSVSSFGGPPLPPNLPPAAGGGKPPSNSDVSKLGGVIPFNREKQTMQLPSDMKRLAAKMGEKMGPEGAKTMELILNGMLMDMINSSRTSNQAFIDALREAQMESEKPS